MLRVSASQFQREFGRLRAVAHREAVVITSHGRDDIVLMSADEYLRLTHPERGMGQPAELTYEQLAAAAGDMDFPAEEQDVRYGSKGFY